MQESVDTRLARLEEGMVSVKGDTSHLRRSFDGFQQRYWLELVKMTAKVAGLSTIVSLVVGTATVLIAKAVMH